MFIKARLLLDRWWSNMDNDDRLTLDELDLIAVLHPDEATREKAGIRAVEERVRNGDYDELIAVAPS
jgi:aryl-alcohol dehydrogenase-like predicted oxidoreductase